MPPRPLVTVLCAFVAAVSAAGCGASDERDVRATLDLFAEATAKKDFQTICDDVFASGLVAKVRAQVPCELALGRSSLADAISPRMEVRRVQVDGDRASATVRTSAENQPASDDTVELVREQEGWRITSLASPSREE
jgi:ketosteroid isomerase-like protein